MDPRELKILMLGDGSGSDTLFLWHHGFRPSYFDVAGSRTSEFAEARFRSHGVQVERVEDYPSLLNGRFDAVWTFEVLEHLPNLPDAIRDIGRMVGPAGIVLATESCEHIRDDLPTHLEINSQYAPRIPELFARAGLRLTWFQPATDFRPSEYRKVSSWNLSARMRARKLERKLVSVRTRRAASPAGAGSFS